MVYYLNDHFSFREEFIRHDLSEVVRVECRDVCRDGFGLSGVVDAGELVTVASEVDCHLDK